MILLYVPLILGQLLGLPTISQRLHLCYKRLSDRYDPIWKLLISSNIGMPIWKVLTSLYVCTMQRIERGSMSKEKNRKGQSLQHSRAILISFLLCMLATYYLLGILRDLCKGSFLYYVIRFLDFFWPTHQCMTQAVFLTLGRSRSSRFKKLGL